VARKILVISRFQNTGDFFFDDYLNISPFFKQAPSYPRGFFFGVFAKRAVLA